jgi:hypothetical protein
MLVPMSVVGVSRLGLVRVGLVANTTFPEPVVGAALMAVPFPWSMPVTVVERVMAGVVVGVATVPARPLAVMTDREVTVPAVAGTAHVGIPPTTVKMFPVELMGNLDATPGADS